VNKLYLEKLNRSIAESVVLVLSLSNRHALLIQVDLRVLRVPVCGRGVMSLILFCNVFWNLNSMAYRKLPMFCMLGLKDCIGILP
jgi:hypothetical protein